jgi:ribosomal silencing factor RsfS
LDTPNSSLSELGKSSSREVVVLDLKNNCKINKYIYICTNCNNLPVYFFINAQ